jgi:para-aminobenzoate synthetase component 1
MAIQFDILGTYLNYYKLDASNINLPFEGGAAGYLSYDLCHFMERLPATTLDDLQLPRVFSLCFIVL